MGENSHRWQDMPHRDNILVEVVPTSEAQRCLNCGAQRAIVELGDGEIHIAGTYPADLSDECPSENASLQDETILFS